MIEKKYFQRQAWTKAVHDHQGRSAEEIQWSTLYTEEEEGQSQSQQHKSKTHKNVTFKGSNPLCST